MAFVYLQDVGAGMGFGNGVGGDFGSGNGGFCGGRGDSVSTDHEDAGGGVADAMVCFVGELGDSSIAAASAVQGKRGGQLSGGGAV